LRAVYTTHRTPLPHPTRGSRLVTHGYAATRLHYTRFGLHTRLRLGYTHALVYRYVYAFTLVYGWLRLPTHTGYTVGSVWLVYVYVYVWLVGLPVYIRCLAFGCLVWFGWFGFTFGLFTLVYTVGCHILRFTFYGLFTHVYTHVYTFTFGYVWLVGLVTVYVYVTFVALLVTFATLRLRLVRLHTLRYTAVGYVYVGCPVVVRSHGYGLRLRSLLRSHVGLRLRLVGLRLLRSHVYFTVWFDFAVWFGLHTFARLVTDFTFYTLVFTRFTLRLVITCRLYVGYSLVLFGSFTTFAFTRLALRLVYPSFALCCSLVVTVTLHLRLVVTVHVRCTLPVTLRWLPPHTTHGWLVYTPRFFALLRLVTFTVVGLHTPGWFVRFTFYCYVYVLQVHVLGLHTRLRYTRYHTHVWLRLVGYTRVATRYVTYVGTVGSRLRLVTLRLRLVGCHTVPHILHVYVPSLHVYGYTRLRVYTRSRLVPLVALRSFAFVTATLHARYAYTRTFGLHTFWLGWFCITHSLHTTAVSLFTLLLGLRWFTRTRVYHARFACLPTTRSRTAGCARTPSHVGYHTLAARLHYTHVYTLPRYAPRTTHALRLPHTVWFTFTRTHTRTFRLVTVTTVHTGCVTVTRFIPVYVPRAFALRLVGFFCGLHAPHARTHTLHALLLLHPVAFTGSVLLDWLVYVYGSGSVPPYMPVTVPHSCACWLPFTARPGSAHWLRTVG